MKIETVAEARTMLAKCQLMTPNVDWTEMVQDPELPTILAVEDMFARKTPWTGKTWSTATDGNGSGAPLDNLECAKPVDDWKDDGNGGFPYRIYDELLCGLFVSDDLVGYWYDDGSTMNSYYVVAFTRETGRMVFSLWVDPSDSSLENVRLTGSPSAEDPYRVLRGHAELAAFLDKFFA